MTVTGYWLDDAACVSADPALFHANHAAHQQQAITDYCDGCTVRAECLADALMTPDYQDFGVRGGTTRTRRTELRQRPDLPTGRDAVTIAALRRLLDEEQSQVPRPAAPPLPHRPSKEKTRMAPTPSEKPEITIEPEPVREFTDLITWGAAHADPAIQRHAALAREALTALEQRRASDAELEQIEREADALRKRIAELDARKAELAPPAAPGKKARDYDPKVVRAWGRARGLIVPDRGQIPKEVLTAWRTRDAA